MSVIKILTVVGTRPNFIKITQLDRVFAQYPNRFQHALVHTGQHFDYSMSDVFFQQLQIREPDYFLQTKANSPVAQMGHIMIEMDRVLQEFKPDLVLVVGDVNSTFAAAFAAHRNHIKVAHIESGLRSFDRDMPEEINRILTDEISDYFFITEPSGIEHLTAAGKGSDQLFEVGNTMIDTLVAFDADIQKDDVLIRMNLKLKGFVLMTMHRPSNVDHEASLQLIVDLIQKITIKLKVVFTVHPRTLQKLQSYDMLAALNSNPQVIICEPLSYFSFQKLVLSSALVLTDSGGIQEETTFRKVPCLTLRKNTERPITVTVGSNELLPFEIGLIENKINDIVEGKYKQGEVPALWDGKATDRIVAKIDQLFPNE